MKVIRVFPRKTNMTPVDPLAFVGLPPMIRPEADEVHISCTFTWDRGYAEYLQNAWGQYYPTVKLGGVAFETPVNGFIPGVYIKNGVTFTSRGCNNNCPFCFVPRLEGKFRPYDEFYAGNIIQDNNILQSDDRHWDKVMSMLKTQHSIQFAGGLQSNLLTDRRASDIRSLKLSQLFMACDYPGALKPLRKAIKKLNLPIDKIRCFVLIGRDNESISDARQRLEDVLFSGCFPFAQLYQPPDKYIEYTKEWRNLAREYSRVPIMRSKLKGLNR